MPTLRYGKGGDYMRDLFETAEPKPGNGGDGGDGTDGGDGGDGGDAGKPKPE